MKTLLAMILLVSPAFAQTYHMSEPSPADVRVEKMTDAELKDLDAKSDARQDALKAYERARDAFNDAKRILASKYHAEAVAGDCKVPTVNVDWRGQYIIVERFPLAPTSGNGWVTVGCNPGNYLVTPTSTLVGSTAIPIDNFAP